MSEKVSYEQMRNLYLDFFRSKDHAVIKSASLIPENDPTVLFTTAGMHPLVPYLLGEKHPEGKKLVDIQKCIRTVDIEEVGDKTHLTFFEMLGNWSLGDYFKKGSLEMSYEFLTQWLKIKPEQLAATVFSGEEGIPKDEESYAIWKSLGLHDDQIFFYGREDNWWGPAGQTGPCGPDSEIFFDNGQSKCGPACGPSCKCGKYVEIWNNVFMEYNKNEDGSYTKLAQQNVDTGMGMERMLAVMNQIDDVYATELFDHTIKQLEELSGKKYNDDLVSFRRVADYTRTAVFILGDERGVAPSNTDQGYVLRRIIRSAIRNLKKLGISDKVLPELADKVIGKYKKYYPELGENRGFVLGELRKEEELFNRTIINGLRELSKVMEGMLTSKIIEGPVAFRLYDTFGFPLEFTLEIAKEHGFSVDEEGFKKRYAEHQELSRKGAEQKFKGGLADNSEATTRLHTAAHLVHEALRRIFGPTVMQRGSNITAERLRFDFSFDRKVTREELDKAEDIVNEIIEKALPVDMEEMTLVEAQTVGAIGIFTSKYDKEKVKVYTIGDFSREICGGPHVNNTSELGRFKIQKEEAVSQGVRRIKAVLS